MLKQIGGDWKYMDVGSCDGSNGGSRNNTFVVVVVVVVVLVLGFHILLFMLFEI
jgi:hypothetical protein